MSKVQRSVVLCGVLGFLAAAPAAAQVVEFGGSIGVACKGSDGSFCNGRQTGLRTAGPEVSVWFGDRVEVGGRLFWLRPRGFEGRSVTPPITFIVTDRRRTIAQAEVVWHFRRGKRVRPLLGLGLGRYWDDEVIACEPAGCESFLGGVGLKDGVSRQAHRDESIVAGISVAAHPRVRVYGGWRYHNAFQDELALPTLFIAAGYKPF